MRDWEYVIVDNCSTDGTREIAERYAAGDGRIRYERHDDYVDVIASHNRGFGTLDPESVYCKVVSGDDWLYPDCLERMVTLADANPRVGFVSAYCRAGDFIDLVGLPYWRTVVSGDEILPAELARRSVRHWNTHVRADPVRAHPRAAAALRSDVPARRHRGCLLDVQALRFRPHPPGTHLQAVGAEWRDSTLSSAELIWGGEPAHADPLRTGTVDETEYRARLRFELRRYVKFHAKQSLKPSRHRDKEFRAFHRRASKLITVEAKGDNEVRRAMGVVQTLLRGR